jgi:hypothetical protein
MAARCQKIGVVAKWNAYSIGKRRWTLHICEHDLVLGEEVLERARASADIENP